MNWKPDSNTLIRKQRARLLHRIRAFFYQRGVLEVETPALSQAANTDPYIESFQVFAGHQLAENHADSAAFRYLHTSPEYPMKRLLAAGSGDIYQIAKVWRQGESGPKHNPEFTLLEWYRVGFSYRRLVQEVDDLLDALIPGLKKDSLITSYRQLFLEKLQIDPHTVKHAELTACSKHNIQNLDLSGLARQDLLDALLTHCIEPHFAKDRLTFITDYPVTQSALATIRETRDGAAVAERFEVYLGPLELGNGYQEETAYYRNSEILDTENSNRKHHNRQAMPQDNRFLAAMQAGLPQCSGVAIGIDRVLMCIAQQMYNTSHLQQVINFSWDKA